jgi:hypothetical protein
MEHELVDMRVLQFEMFYKEPNHKSPPSLLSYSTTQGKKNTKTRKGQ